MQEGSIWEALQFALKHKLGNLIIIVDFNRLQALDFIVNILDRKESDMLKKLRGFGLEPVLCHGHNPDRLADCLVRAKAYRSNFPKVILARTIKGFGLKCMENAAKFHYRIPSDEELLRGRSYETAE